MQRVDSPFHLRRRGTGIYKALALGAPRLFAWVVQCAGGLGAYGAAGVQRALEILQAELILARSHTGRPTRASLDHTAHRHAGGRGEGVTATPPGGPAFEGTPGDVDSWADANGRVSFLGRFVGYLKARGHLQDFTFFSFEHYPCMGTQSVRRVEFALL